MKDQVLAVWKSVTLRRHKSELRALRTARSIGPLAIFPIFFTLTFWLFPLALPSTVLGGAGITLIEAEPRGMRLLGWLLYFSASLYALAAICAAAAWFFRWYFIAVSLMFGRHAMADRKETELVAAIAAAAGAYRANDPTSLPLPPPLP
ncbi:MAG: hypothetical protein IOD05_11440 [Rhodobacter sp.]|nr:hypothetical protein [Rhodobacter sp.]MCA3494368.1 hypothetical protein [Rhodobacter sp.]MCA3499852.1 hypothetical protein [Rhodobacter sp.]MCA3503831.1 hypothetical protein [Rhodobacter sp.]MCA3517835.1 hypothetical protein [Rhodobacter sp.]